MKLLPVLTWVVAGETAEPLDPRLLPLLKAIGATASLTAAVASCGVSYRAAWGLLRDYERRAGTPLALLERGRGARLTAAGQGLLDGERQAALRLAPHLRALDIEIGAAPHKQKPASVVPLRIAASHDLALAALAAGLASEVALDLDLSFVGSLHGLREFAEGRAGLAGFHVPMGGRIAWDRTPFVRGLNARRHRLIRFVDRDQGLILPRGGAAGVASLRDVAERALRFINRQRGSGTRVLIDQILASESVDPRDLDGYDREEFTHLAVAATVASGGADAGFGLRAAAAEYGLAFVPLVRERYYLAVRATDVEAPGVARLIRLLRSRAFGALSRRFPGYRSAAAGTVVPLDALARA